MLTTLTKPCLSLSSTRLSLLCSKNHSVSEGHEDYLTTKDWCVGGLEHVILFLSWNDSGVEWWTACKWQSKSHALYKRLFSLVSYSALRMWPHSHLFLGCSVSLLLLLSGKWFLSFKLGKSNVLLLKLYLLVASVAASMQRKWLTGLGNNKYYVRRKQVLTSESPYGELPCNLLSQWS